MGYKDLIKITWFNKDNHRILNRIREMSSYKLNKLDNNNKTLDFNSWIKF